MKYILILGLFCLVCNGIKLEVNAQTVSASREFARFTDVHKQAGIKSTGSLAHSATWVDVNGDGCQDLVATNTNIRRRPRTYLFLNKCDGTFRSILTEASGISDYWFIRSVTAADFDNDGNVDLVLGGIDTKGYPFLYQNIGEGMFVDVSEIANLRGQGYFSSLTWADYNLDGWIDLYQGGISKYLYKNMGNARFEDVALEAGLDNYSKNLSSIWFDYNNDKYPDLFLSNEGYNTLYKNNADGTFTDVTSDANLKGDKTWKTTAACSADFNNDGYFDLYVVNISSERKALYKNNGDGTFTDVTGNSGTADVGDGRTCSFIDYNSDGLMDIFTTNHIKPSKLFKNNGDGTFTNMSFTLGIDRPIDAFSATWGDFNGDTKLDVFLNGHIGIALYEGFNLNNSVIIELVGDGINTNTSAIGSRVELTTKSVRQTREVAGGKGCCESDMLPIHFGLGEETQFNLIVDWTNGEKCKYQDLRVENGLYYKVSQKGCEMFSY